MQREAAINVQFLGCRRCRGAREEAILSITVPGSRMTIYIVADEWRYIDGPAEGAKERI